VNTLAKLSTLSILTASIAVSSCNTEDPGPLQETEKKYAIVDFDRIEMGSGFHIDVKQSGSFRVKAEGDRRNIDDLEVFKSGSTLIVKYKDNGNRTHETHIAIEMPVLNGANFSGGSESEIKDFESDGTLELVVSGGSVSQVDAGYRVVRGVVSGASSLVMRGLGDEVNVEVSGASSLVAFDYPVRQAKLTVSGASHAKVTVTDDLDVTASGTSALLYRGSPTVTSSVTGASSVQKDQ